MKAIKTELLEKRFQKLHTLIEYAQESCKAIEQQTKQLEKQGQTKQQEIANLELRTSINQWCDSLSILDSSMKEAEELCYRLKSADGKTCETFDPIPVCPKEYMPNTFQMTDTFYRVGYYVIEGDPFNMGERKFSVPDILRNIQELHINITFCLKALANATYQGIWEHVGTLIYKLCDFEPNCYLIHFFKSYQMSPNKG